jgi:hypothetical protein
MCILNQRVPALGRITGLTDPASAAVFGAVFAILAILTSVAWVAPRASRQRGLRQDHGEKSYDERHLQKAIPKQHFRPPGDREDISFWQSEFAIRFGRRGANQLPHSHESPSN